MRIAIDYNIDRDEVSLISEVADNSCAESCINFTTHKEKTILVHFEQNGERTETTIPVVHCLACYKLNDAAMRTAGEFTVCADGKTPLRFAVEQEIPAGAEYSVSLAKGVFHVRAVSSAGGGDFGMYAFHIDENGHLICTYDTSDPPPLSIDENGHLIYTIGG